MVNNYVAGWPYTRMVDAKLVAHWKTLPRFQPESMWIAYRDGHPRAFLHGEREGDQLFVHLLALMPGAAEEGVWLLREMEACARGQGIRKLIGPHYRTNVFYGAYVLGCEPYHPHWAIEGTEVWVRAGFTITLQGIVQIRGVSNPVTMDPVPAGYTVEEMPERCEFDARTTGFRALYGGKEVAHCHARLYLELKDRSGLPVGQIGHVGTDTEHQGKGLARVLCQMSAARLQRWGGGECLVATSLNNPSAMRAYEKAGFERRFTMVEWTKTIG